MKTIVVTTLDNQRQQIRDVLLHTAFQCVVTFMEHAEEIDWGADTAHKHAWAELQALHNWWVNVRPKRVHPLSVFSPEDIPPMKFKRIPGVPGQAYDGYDTSHPNHGAYTDALRRAPALEASWDREDMFFFHRLVDIYQYLWV